MRTLTLALAATACVGLAVPAFGECGRYAAADDAAVSALVQDARGAPDQFSAQKKSEKKKKKDESKRSTWGG